MVHTEEKNPMVAEGAVEETEEVDASSCCSTEANDEAEIDGSKDRAAAISEGARCTMVDEINQMVEMGCATETEEPAQTEKAAEKTEKKGITIVEGPPEAPEIAKEKEALKQAELLVEANKLAGLLGKGTFEDLLDKGERGWKAVDSIRKAFQESSDPKALAVALERMLKMNGSPYSVAYEKLSRPGGEAVLALEKSLGKDKWGTESRERSEIKIPGPNNNPWDRIRPPIRLYEKAN